MAKGPTFKVKFRRRREGRTNYYRRRRLLLSRLPRLVVRKTNTRTIVQVVNAQVVGDNTVASASSAELSNHGWNAGSGNLPAAYLTGLLAGRRAKERGITRVVLDLGIHPPVKGSKVYAALKGAVDAGLDVPHSEDILPDDDRLSGKHIVVAYDHFKDNKDSHQFSKLGKKKTTITTIPSQFDKTKKAILAITKAELKKPTKKPAAKTALKKKVEKPKKEKPEVKPPRAVPRKPKPKKLIARGKGKKGKR